MVMREDHAEAPVHALDIDDRVRKPALHTAARADPLLRKGSIAEEWVRQWMQVASRVESGSRRVGDWIAHYVRRDVGERRVILVTIDSLDDLDHHAR